MANCYELSIQCMTGDTIDKGYGKVPDTGKLNFLSKSNYKALK